MSYAANQAIRHAVNQVETAINQNRDDVDLSADERQTLGEHWQTVVAAMNELLTSPQSSQQ